MTTTSLHSSDLLPLTCTREGTCCHAKTVWLNPWEIARLAQGRGLSSADFHRAHVDHGIRLRFDGATGKLGAACSQYAPGIGCIAHPHRPLACRLYPLGREKRGAQVRYVHEGRSFPCLNGCPGVTALPAMTVGDYLTGQDVGPGEIAQDAYLEMAQDLAEGAFVVLFDSGLAVQRGPQVLAQWKAVIEMDAAGRQQVIGGTWFDLLTAPRLSEDPGDPAAWIAAHRQQFQGAAQAAFAHLRDPETLAEASVRFLALALHLVQAVGAADPAEVGRRWLTAAKNRGL